MAEKAPPRPRGKLQNACSRTGTSGRESVAGKDLHKHDKPPPPGDEVQLAQGGGGREKDKEVELERWGAVCMCLWLESIPLPKLLEDHILNLLQSTSFSFSP